MRTFLYISDLSFKRRRFEKSVFIDEAKGWVCFSLLGLLRGFVNQSQYSKQQCLYKQQWAVNKATYNVQF